MTVEAIFDAEHRTSSRRDATSRHTYELLSFKKNVFVE